MSFLAVASVSSGAVTLFQTDNFQDEDTAGWSHGPPSPIPPYVEVDVGPDGVGDHSLYVSSFGSGGPGGRWIAFNRFSNWTGDYLASGFGTLELDVFNFSGTGLTLRVGVIGPGGSFVTDGVTLDDTGEWERISFSLLPDDLIKVLGTDVNLTLSAVNEIRIFENASVSILGDTVAADVYLDNITALPGIPEPSRAMLCVLAFAAAAFPRMKEGS